MKVKEESEKAGLKLNIQKTKIMVSGPITSWQIDGETMETVTEFTVMAFLTYMQSTSWETLDWMKHKLESCLPGEISITSDMQMTPPLRQKVRKN